MIQYVANFTLSNGNLTFTATSGGAYASGLAVAGATGKVYWEVQIDAVGTSSDQTGVGMGNTSINLSSYLGADTNSIGYFGPQGTVLTGNAVVANLVTYATNDRICIAYDTTGAAIWFRVNGGSWNNGVGGTPDPSTGVGGISASGLSLPGYAGTSNQSCAGTGKFTSASFSQSIPSGYSAYG